MILVPNLFPPPGGSVLRRRHVLAFPISNMASTCEMYRLNRTSCATRAVCMFICMRSLCMRNLYNTIPGAPLQDPAFVTPISTCVIPRVPIHAQLRKYPVLRICCTAISSYCCCIAAANSDEASVDTSGESAAALCLVLIIT